MIFKFNDNNVLMNIGLTDFYFQKRCSLFLFTIWIVHDVFVHDLDLFLNEFRGLMRIRE